MMKNVQSLAIVTYFHINVDIDISIEENDKACGCCKQLTIWVSVCDQIFYKNLYKIIIFSDANR